MVEKWLNQWNGRNCWSAWPEQVRCGGHITFPRGKPASETSERVQCIKTDMVYLGL